MYSSSECATHPAMRATRKIASAASSRSPAQNASAAPAKSTFGSTGTRSLATASTSCTSSTRALGKLGEVAAVEEHGKARIASVDLVAESGDVPTPPEHVGHGERGAPLPGVGEQPGDVAGRADVQRTAAGRPGEHRRADVGTGRSGDPRRIRRRGELVIGQEHERRVHGLHQRATDLLGAQPNGEGSGDRTRTAATAEHERRAGRRGDGQRGDAARDETAGGDDHRGRADVVAVEIGDRRERDRKAEQIRQPGVDIGERCGQVGRRPRAAIGLAVPQERGDLLERV